MLTLKKVIDISIGLIFSDILKLGKSRATDYIKKISFLLKVEPHPAFIIHK